MTSVQQQTVNALDAGANAPSDPPQILPDSSNPPVVQDDGSEATQPESDSEDEFFPADADPTSLAVDKAVRAQEEVLSREQLCLRRLSHLQELQELYKAELWGTLEEMRARYHYFMGPDVAGTTDSVPGFEPLQSVLRKRKVPQAQAATAGERDADTGEDTSDIDVVMVDAPASPSGQAPALDREPGGPEAAGHGSAAFSERHTQAMGRAVEVAEPPTFSDAEEFVLASNSAPADAEALASLRRKTRTRLSRIARLEQAASASTARQLDRTGALAMLSGHRVKFLIKRSAFTIGRPTSSHGAVDVDVAREGDASQVSRQQARLALRPDGAFCITNCGRRKLHVNGCQVERGQSALMQHLSLLEVGGIRLLLHINHSAVRRLITRSASFGDFPVS